MSRLDVDISGLVRTVIACAAAGVLAGCASGPASGLPEGSRIVYDRLFGEWRSPDAAAFRVEPGPEDSVIVTVADEPRPTRYVGWHVEVPGGRLLELSLDGSKSPSFYYSHVRVRGDELSTRSLQEQWLRANAVRGAVAVGDPQIDGAEGGALVRDRAAMEDLLRRALTDPGAFTEPEVYTRVK